MSINIRNREVEALPWGDQSGDEEGYDPDRPSNCRGERPPVSGGSVRSASVVR